MKTAVRALLLVTLAASSAAATEFDQNEPLAPPADGTHFLYIDDLGGTADNTGVFVNTGITIADLSVYRIEVATGHAVGEVLARQSIQAWASPTGTNLDSFIGQNWSQSGAWVDAPEGEWANNQVIFVGSPTTEGLLLMILATNYNGGGSDPEDTGRAYWDNVRVFVNDVPTFSDSFEIGLVQGEEAEVTDAGWNLHTSTEENSGIGTPLPDAPSDIDGDGDVDFTDFAVLNVNYLQDVPGGLADGDINGSGRVDMTDFLIFESNFTGTIAHAPNPGDELEAFILGGRIIRLEGNATLSGVSVRSASGALVPVSLDDPTPFQTLLANDPTEVTYASLGAVTATVLGSLSLSVTAQGTPGDLAVEYMLVGDPTTRTVPVQVPEPSAGLMGLTGSLVLVWAGRRRARPHRGDGAPAARADSRSNRRGSTADPHPFRFRRPEVRHAPRVRGRRRR